MANDLRASLLLSSRHVEAPRADMSAKPSFDPNFAGFPGARALFSRALSWVVPRRHASPLVDSAGDAWRGKRILDIAGTLMLAPAALIIVAVAALLILVTCGRPVFFFQKRVGAFGRVFSIYKLRTMSSGRCTIEPTRESDPRITPLGHALRKYRIDELPQLLNVLKGDMSLIGPRPEQPHLVDVYRQSIPRFGERHAVKPGITGLAQVCYKYAADAGETRNKVRYDLLYVRRKSLALDLWIGIRTIATVLRGSGAR